VTVPGEQIASGLVSIELWPVRSETGVFGAVLNAWKLKENDRTLYTLDINIDKEGSNCLIKGTLYIFPDDVRDLGDVSRIVIKYFQFASYCCGRQWWPKWDEPPLHISPWTVRRGVSVQSHDHWCYRRHDEAARKKYAPHSFLLDEHKFSCMIRQMIHSRQAASNVRPLKSERSNASTPEDVAMLMGKESCSGTLNYFAPSASLPAGGFGDRIIKIDLPVPRIV